MWSHHCSIIGIVLLVSIGASVNGLYCFKCLNVDCSIKDPECKQIRTFIQDELKKLYYFKDSSDLNPCPKVEQRNKWKLMQIGHQHNYDTCPEAKAKEATCTLGRLQIKTTKSNPAGGEPTVQLNHATIMGCAKRDLLRRIYTPNTCDLAIANKTSDGVMRELLIDHCSDIKRLCFEKDYCVNYTQSYVKRWDNPEDPGNNHALLLGIFAVVIIVIFALLLLGCLFHPGGDSSDIPIEAKEDQNLYNDDSNYSAKVYHVKREHDKIASIEVDPGSSNKTDETITPIDSIPPTPARGQMDRENTPV